MKFILITLSLLLFLFAGYKSQDLKRTFNHCVRSEFSRKPPISGAIITQDSIAHLPKPVQKYLAFVGAIGKERVYNVKIVAEGEMKLTPQGSWSPADVVQYNFWGYIPTRFFYITVSKFGFPILGLHTYDSKNSRINIKLAGLFTIADATGREMRETDTVTLFNDMCLFAPASLIDERIHWEALDDLTVKTTFSTQDCTVSALLYFKENGELANFVSDDRYYMMKDGSFKKFTWSTLIQEYQEQNGVRFVSRGEAVWNMPEGDYSYFRVTKIKQIAYNFSAIE